MELNRLMSLRTDHRFGAPLNGQDLVPDGELNALDFSFILHPGTNTRFHFKDLKSESLVSVWS